MRHVNHLVHSLTQSKYEVAVSATINTRRKGGQSITIISPLDLIMAYCYAIALLS